MKKEAKGKKGDRRKARRATFEELQAAAYQNWQKRGSPPGDGLADWLEAERRAEEEAEGLGDEEERRWEEKDPRDEEPNEAP